jgi:hypothetical protein
MMWPPLPDGIGLCGNFSRQSRCCIRLPVKHRVGSGDMAISFKGALYPKSVILFAVFFYVRYAVSYRDLEEIMADRGVTVDHAMLNRWVVR